MAQLSDDCFAFGGPLLSVEAAEALIAERIPPIQGAETLPLTEAAGRVLARALHASLPLPPFFNSAVDGYAFRHADLTPGEPSLLPLAGRIAAGHVAEQAPAPGQAARIFTGAPMPPGADTVVMQEDAVAEGRGVWVPPGLKPGANARPAGEDVAAGALALPAGRRLRAPEIGLAAALGHAALPVVPRVRVGVFSTGDELATPGTPLGPAQAYDSNRFTLLALLARLPVMASDLGILPDDPAATAAALRAAAGSHDLLLTSGGVSTGEEDHVRAAIEAGGRLVFWRLAVKPGRPVAMGVLPKSGGDFAAGGTPVIGLPGNPVAAVVTFLHLARPLVLRLAGALPEVLPRFPAEAGFSYRKKAGRREYVRVRLRDGVAFKFEREGAGLLTSLTESDAFVELPEAVLSVAPGDAVRVLPFATLF
ncbi:molybdopterin molybdotransferase MoeA [Belnapia rosea]|uniref:molybdopterin molybdotransferase MoeA n=1 Tax=Belnapia rosea TaxID=938405 RepID=UPI0008839CC1|nr:gephyrin-like molybdotransferase Glp [Belnapia rosea]SDB70251.1 molybdopterin molybdotransferase [Belnapia rosea]